MDTPGILVTEAVHGVDRTEQNLTRLSKKATGQQRGGRTRTVKNCKLELEKRPGVQPIKQVDLYEKWGPLVPEEFRNDICAKPPEAIIATVKEARKAKQNAKKAQNDRRTAKRQQNKPAKTLLHPKTQAKTKPKLSVKEVANSFL